ncbi:enoyl-CoA hydratase/isomerase family protein [Pseudonocardia sp. H11422]|uniref:enoyl-CoA hydratase/isomerase family protein n=1 Tax=Pseudonocardia sp. H11422 TaxID=2835866 RepID=UPI001BDC0EFE|nr:enoyl-CoA hydratase-related protein [Pseudonocardia sp. H11422]
MASDAVILSVADGVARVRMNRPAARNAWDDTLGEGLSRALSEVASRDDVRVVVLEGEGSVFCAGADLVAGFPTLESGRDDLRSVLRTRFHPAFLALLDVPQPVIAAVHGPAIGAGACLALAADLAVLSRGAYLQFRFARIGLMPDVGATALLATAVGPARATELLLLADPIAADECAALGLVSRVVDAGAVEKECLGLAARLAEGPTRAYATTKRAVRAWSRRAVAEQLELEAELQQTLTGTADWCEGRAAFRERRDPRFTGT